jgi:hypothetical protein
MSMHHLPRILALLGLAGLLCGCNAPGNTLEAASRTELPSRSWPEIMDAAERTMREFFTVDTVDPASGLIRALPATTVSERPASAFGPELSSPAEIRRLAELQVSGQGGAVVAACRILIQRNQETEARPFLQQATSDEIPNQTPLEESRGLQAVPGVAWTTVGRDQQLEQAVLAALHERLGN